jgi:membrane-bound serine protease (ClpP class)
MFLIAVIGMGAYVEFQSPGLGLPGLAAVLALAVFLGAPYLTGLANAWEIVVIFLGLALILVEVLLIPGFGVAGIAGTVLLIVGLLATFMPEEPGKMPFYWPEMPQSFEGLKTGVVTLAGGIVVSLAGMFMLSRYLPQIPYLRNIAPANPTAEAVTIDDPYDGLAHVGDVGRCEGPLRPAGKARFGSRLVDVVSEGDLIPGGMEIEVIERRGNRVVVRPVASA